MKLRIYGVYDKAIASFNNTPFFQLTDAAAIRLMRDETVRGESQIALHPEDYDLHFLGEYDQVTGEIKPANVRLTNCRALIVNATTEDQ